LSFHAPFVVKVTTSGVGLGTSGVDLGVGLPASKGPTSEPSVLYDLDLALAVSASMASAGLDTMLSVTGFSNPNVQCFAVSALTTFWNNPKLRAFFKSCRSVILFRSCSENR
jgi:hypothetical protein